MANGLVSLPFDIIHHIAGQLDVRTYDNLASTCHRLRDHLQEESTAKRSIQASISCSPWAKETYVTPAFGWRRILRRANDAQRALQGATPYSVCVLAHATSFSYNSGTLCYLTSSSLRILSLNERRGTEKVLDLTAFSDYIVSAPASGRDSFTLGSVKSVHVQAYAYGIVVLLCSFGVKGHHLFAVDISDDHLGSTKRPWCLHHRIILCTAVRSDHKIFVRHNRTHMIVGTHSAIGDDNHREWLLQGYDLRASKPVTKEPMQLRNFHGSELGSTVCFTIYEGDFYALTNQTSLESEEVDWTSYYHFIRFALDDSNPDLSIRTIWRRQHLEGPIHDSWTNLGFQIDHRTGELLIVECRREWLNGGSRAVRTAYTQPFHRAVHGNLDGPLRHPPNDPLSRTVDGKSNARWEEPYSRIDRFVHAESEGLSTGGFKEYIRAKIKWHGYKFNSQAFVDLVTDEVRTEGAWSVQERTRLRVVARNQLNPLDRDPRVAGPHGVHIRPCRRDRHGVHILDGEEAFTRNQSALWPPDDAPPEIDDIMCPGGRAGTVTAVLGDEGLIYMAGPSKGSGSPERALVFVSFDPTFGFEGMKRLDGTAASRKAKSELEREVRKRKSDLGDDSSEEKVRGGGQPRLKKVRSNSDNPVFIADARLLQTGTNTCESHSATTLASTRTPSPCSPSLRSSAGPEADTHPNPRIGQVDAGIRHDRATHLSIRHGIWLR